MNSIFKWAAAALLAVSAASGAPQVSAQTGETPVITFKTNIYDQFGAQNAFHLVIGTTQTDYYDVDCGFGPVEVEVTPAVFDSESQAIKGTTVSCQVNADGMVRIYGDPSKIDYFAAEGCYIDWIEMDECVNLSVLDLQHNELKHLDLTPFSSLEALYLTGNTFTAETPLKVGGNKPRLQILELDIIEYLDQSFNLSDYPALVLFNGYHNMDLRNVDPSGCPELLVLILEMAPVETLDVSHNPKLMRLNISDTRIRSIDISKNPGLQNFLAQHVSGTINTDIKLTDIDLSNNPNLVLLNMAGNRLKNIDLSKNTMLTNLSLARNELSEIDLTANTNLYSVDLSNNYLNFATLPLPRDAWGEYYYYRSPLPCDKSYAAGADIDFSAQVLREGTTTSARVWQDPVGGDPVLLDESAYVYADGKIKFNSAISDSVYVEFGNSAFLDYSLRSASFMVKDAGEMGKPSKIASLNVAAAMAGKEVSFKVGMSGATDVAPKTFYVKTGDGEMREFSATSDALPAVCNFAETVNGACELAVYVPEGEVMTAFAIEDVTLGSIDITGATEVRDLVVKGCGLSAINLGYNRCLQRLDISGNRLGNVTLEGVFGDYEKNVLTDIDASNNRLYNFKVVSTTQIRSMNLANNMLTSFVLKNYDGLTNLDLSGNRLKEEVNLAYLGNAENINLSNNRITNLVVGDMPLLRRFDVSNNNLTLETLPYLEGVSSEVYIYSPQKNLEIAAKAPGINITSQNRVIAGQATRFEWKKTDGTPLREGVDVECNGGATRFLDLELGTVYCEMTHPAFPEFAGEKVFRTTDVTVTGAPTTVVASFTTTEDSEAAEVIFTGVSTSALYIDWRGDGTEYIQYPINGNSYSSYPGQKTYAGANVKVYTYDSTDDIVQFAIYDAPMSRMDASPMKNLKSFSVGGAGLDENTLIFPASPGLEEITLSDNAFSKKDFNEFSSLKHLVLSGNSYETFNAGDKPELQTLVVSKNKLTDITFKENGKLWGLDVSGNELEEINFGETPNLTQIIASNNKLASIDLTPVRNVLVALDLQRNRFTFHTLPLRNDYPNLGVYLFIGQAPMPITCTDGVVDLSLQAKVGDSATTFRWFMGEVTEDPETGELVGEELETGGDDPEYTVVDGITTFHYTFEGPLTCVMTNEAYSGLNLFTEPVIVDKAGLEGVTADDSDATVDVYTVTGIRVRSGVARADALRGLAPGFYICGGRKVLVR